MNIRLNIADLYLFEIQLKLRSWICYSIWRWSKNQLLNHHSLQKIRYKFVTRFSLFDLKTKKINHFFYHFWQIQNFLSKEKRCKLITRFWLFDSKTKKINHSFSIISDKFRIFFRKQNATVWLFDSDYSTRS